MDKPTHTPGPWTLTHIRGNNFAIQEFEIRGVLFGNPGKNPIFNKDTSAIDGAHIFVSPEDARLIAAAPELLEALRRCKFDSLNMSLADLEFCRAAYAKATA